MSKILRRHRSGSTTHEGWKHTKQITKDELKEMPDPDGGRAAQMAVAIPSPFARMHLVETALEYVKLHPAETASIHHRLLGQLWDAWEIIFNYHQLERAGQKLLIRTWQRQAEMAALEANPATRALGQVLRLYLEQSDPRFSTLTDLHLFYWTKPDGTPHLLAGTSPLTVLFPAPDLVEPLMQRTAGGGHYFDGTYVALNARETAFHDYLYELWVAEPGFRTHFAALEQVLDVSIINKLDFGVKPDLSANYERLRDHVGNDVTIGGLPLRVRRNESIIASSDFFIVPTKAVPAPLPLVLKPGMRAPGKKYFNSKAWDDATVVPAADPRLLTDRTLPGVGFQHPYLTINDFLEDTLLAVPYPIDDKKFVIGQVKVARDAPEAFGPLLPLKPRFFDYFTPADLARLLMVEVTAHNVRVTLRIPVTGGGFIEYERAYYDNPQIDGVGQLRVTNIGLAIFPFVRVADAPQFNDFYKVMLVDANILDVQVVHQPVKLEFWHQGAALTAAGTEKSATRYDRTAKTVADEGSAYYEIQGQATDVAFEFIVVQHPGGGQSLAVPQWPTVTQGTAQFRFAVDFGTTNTHVAWNESSTPEPKPFGFGASESPVGLLKKAFVKKDQNGHPLATQEQTLYERLLMGIDADPVRRIQIKRWQTYLEREFVPPLLAAEGSPYAFPIRTATSESADFTTRPAALLGNINIGFGLITEELATAAYVTNLKWSIGSDRFAEARVRAFFEGLVLLFRAKVLLSQPAGRLADTRLTWFYPLSFSVPQRNLFQREWDRAFQRFFHTTQPTVSVAESTAPYYYLTDLNKITLGETDTAAFIDIGGGTTDVLLYADREPVLNTSFRFAGTDLWGDGGARVTRKENGLVRFGLDSLVPATFTPAAHRAHSRVKAADNNPRYSSDDVASFLFAYDAELGFSRQLHQAQHLRVLFYLHFGAILYHIGQLTQLYGLRVPRYLCLTGRGSLYVQLLRDGSDTETVTAMARRILEAVAGPVPANFAIVFVPDPKQATANGGVLANVTARPKPRPALPVGQAPAAEVRTAEGQPTPHTLQPAQITDAVQQAVLANVSACLDLLLTDPVLVGLLPDLGIRNAPGQVRALLDRSLADSFTFHRQRYANTLEAGASIPETLFFLPLKEALVQLSKELHPATSTPTA
jgi:hypothetical protein